jgi:N-acetyl-anhydromuramyl-L-alanine amidase AmpD
MKIPLILTLTLSLSSLAAENDDIREKTELIIIHHSATEGGDVETFRKYHVEVRGWSDIGYHFVICNGKGGKGKDGEIQKGRPEARVGSHAKGRNRISVGICLVGKDNFSSKQKESLIKLIRELCVRYNIKADTNTIQVHHEECPGPGLDLKEIISQL